ncbi:Choline trimethylamine-lyase activating enzyme [Paenibacillus plantiphilus]|uniref:Choline trimethylamine-lyase activating enzyme n=1 Tax=Paenibacillus plantiphilus TaxID=2905650 RepID=A0ABN8GHB2_9BACL|nr:ferredoxin family protein [Paenibacillus plantiphilus]CAH1209320.1 Choline trimethylamine-lyase activating enzyme [Paenibacillus plantiphilus]
MIELVSEDRCIQCKICVKVCPTNVFDTNEIGLPVIARQEDCQTCFVCEAYCPVDALYVSPFADELEHVQEETLIEKGLLGSWRAEIGWSKEREGSMPLRDTTHFLNSIRPTPGG